MVFFVFLFFLFNNLKRFTLSLDAYVSEDGSGDTCELTNPCLLNDCLKKFDQEKTLVNIHIVSDTITITESLYSFNFDFHMIGGEGEKAMTILTSPLTVKPIFTFGAEGVYGKFSKLEFLSLKTNLLDTSKTVDVGSSSISTLMLTNSKITNCETPLFSQVGNWYISNLLISGVEICDSVAPLKMTTTSRDNGVSVTVKDSKFTGNIEGVIDISSKSIITTKILDSFFENNEAQNGGCVRIASLTSSVEECKAQSEEKNEISENLKNDDSVFGLRVELTRSTFTNSSANIGGGVLLITKKNDLYVNITDCFFKDGSSYIDGGAVHLTSYQNTVLNVENATFSQNSAFEDGGAIFSSTDENTYAQIVDSTFFENSGSLRGGAVYLESDSVIVDLSVHNTVFDSNFGGYGGSIVITGGTTKLEVQKSMIYNSVAQNGGGIFCFSGETNVILNNTIVENCTGLSAGGGLLIMASRIIDVTSTNNQYIGNQAPNGGSVFISAESYHSNLVFSQDLFINNIASISGAAIHCVDYYSDEWFFLNIFDCVMTNNTQSNPSQEKKGIVIHVDKRQIQEEQKEEQFHIILNSNMISHNVGTAIVSFVAEKYFKLKFELFQNTFYSNNATSTFYSEGNEVEYFFQKNIWENNLGEVSAGEFKNSDLSSIKMYGEIVIGHISEKSAFYFDNSTFVDIQNFTAFENKGSIISMRGYVDNVTMKGLKFTKNHCDGECGLLNVLYSIEDPSTTGDLSLKSIDFDSNGIINLLSVSVDKKALIEGLNVIGTEYYDKCVLIHGKGEFNFKKSEFSRCGLKVIAEGEVNFLGKDEEGEAVKFSSGYSIFVESKTISLSLEEVDLSFGRGIVLQDFQKFSAHSIHSHQNFGTPIHVYYTSINQIFEITGDSFISQNDVLGIAGGIFFDYVIENDLIVPPVISSSVSIDSNVADFGGGMFFLLRNQGLSVDITKIKSKITNNTANKQGGGVFIHSKKYVELPSGINGNHPDDVIGSIDQWSVSKNTFFCVLEKKVDYGRYECTANVHFADKINNKISSVPFPFSFSFEMEGKEGIIGNLTDFEHHNYGNLWKIRVKMNVKNRLTYVAKERVVVSLKLKDDLETLSTKVLYFKVSPCLLIFSTCFDITPFVFLILLIILIVILVVFCVACQSYFICVMTLQIVKNVFNYRSYNDPNDNIDIKTRDISCCGAKPFSFLPKTGKFSPIGENTLFSKHYLKRFKESIKDSKNRRRCGLFPEEYILCVFDYCVISCILNCLLVLCCCFTSTKDVILDKPTVGSLNYEEIPDEDDSPPILDGVDTLYENVQKDLTIQ